MEEGVSIKWYAPKTKISSSKFKVTGDFGKDLYQYLLAMREDVVEAYRRCLYDEGLDKNNRLPHTVDAFVSNTADKATLSLKLPGYVQWFVLGRKAGKRPPISSLADWARRKHLGTDNSTLYALANHIAKHGCKPHPGAEPKRWLEKWLKEKSGIRDGILELTKAEVYKKIEDALK